MLRIHFSAQDLARTRINDEPHPLWETLLSLHALQIPDGRTVFGPWRQYMRAEMPRQPLQALLELAPATGYSPDFLTPMDATAGLEPGLEALVSTPKRRVREQIAELASRQRVSSSVRQLVESGRSQLRGLADVLRDYHRTAVAPYSDSIRAATKSDHVHRSHTLVTGGVDRLLAGLHPRVRWRPPVLEVLDFADVDVHLDGRGLLLQPSYFCWQAPTKLRDPGSHPVLVYPVERQHSGLRCGEGPQSQSDRAVEALLGRTRAVALEATAQGSTTSDLARACRVSMATASHHASVLRDAGLVSTRRDGGSAVHHLTKLGSSVLTGSSTVEAVAGLEPSSHGGSRH